MMRTSRISCVILPTLTSSRMNLIPSRTVVAAVSLLTMTVMETCMTLPPSQRNNKSSMRKHPLPDSSALQMRRPISSSVWKSCVAKALNHGSSLLVMTFARCALSCLASRRTWSWTVV
ncbi:hypothetical protein FR483_n341L [Paramecium bursaria Chlorella virus FR483]|uniref:Uncharacterized protein n341L n=1 Tax=Paramecium bursaria Chlorella virus FR483 TaxID=399781 RepID=A7J745_PBCVF|nr:hypothetical protein FR483_n341L [Paramecium bursaria Chlorella virus FR483]ABT15626.1 hypothetical protein FR483_n341L [Paramecium bursaria Chlorella virus FR483]